MTEQIDEAIKAIRRFVQLREVGRPEAALREEFVSRLRPMFPDEVDQRWINRYSEGAESKTVVPLPDGNVANRFIDNLVGSTTIEYKSDLRDANRVEDNETQVREQIAGLIASGCPVSHVRGVLSDTVRWMAYDAEITSGIEPGACSPDDVMLTQVDSLDITAFDETAAAKLLIAFVRKHLAREKSRVLSAQSLVLDLGLESEAYAGSAARLSDLVSDGREADSSIRLATDLWSGFVDYLEGGEGAFRASAYVDEAYLCVLARLLSANVLSEGAIASDDDDLKSILDGTYFSEQYQLANMVEQDYFGWFTREDYIDRLVPVARDVQQDLYAYDYSWCRDEDLFGRLMAQLARRSERRLLGQEWTPEWLAHHLAEKCMDNLPEEEPPRIIDMCCGSGSILAEVLKSAKSRSRISEISDLQSVVTGFDIDPLAVSLAKTTWVVTLADEIKQAAAPVTIPVYHADSLFSVTPITRSLPLFGESGPISISLDGVEIEMPESLFHPEYRSLFDRIVDWAHDEAVRARGAQQVQHLTEQHAAEFLSGAVNALGVTLGAELERALTPAVSALVSRMAELAVAGRNGIWAFILRSTYRPGLLVGQFNGLVSNPPWLAMSRLGDNPYRELLTARARLYGIHPPGQSFLHLELGTTHLLHAVDRYLAEDAAVACLIPGTVFNGHHHEPFRKAGFLAADRPVGLAISEVWQVEPGTFSYPGAAVIGRKRAQPFLQEDTGISGHLAQPDAIRSTNFVVRAIGESRTAWVLERDGSPAIAAGGPMPQQGADLMPRIAVCVDILSDDEAEHRVSTPTISSPYGFATKGAKILKGSRFHGYVEPRFIYRMAQSENLLPFVFGEHCAPIAIPAVRDENSAWQILDEAEIGRLGFVQTARRFEQINRKLQRVGNKRTLQQRIDEHGKLSHQVLPEHGYVILSGAGGKHICGACVSIADFADIVIDQTLYWRVLDTEDEARFYVGMLNSHAMTEAIKPFNPKGAFGERHVHTLPYRLMPSFSPNSEDHARIAAIAGELEQQARVLVAEDEYLNSLNGALPVRRSRLRSQLADTAQFQQLEQLCADALGTTAFGDSENGDECP